jgi:CRP/FNR family transcriptional regulator, anaerobic regulatory protein
MYIKCLQGGVTMRFINNPSGAHPMDYANTPALSASTVQQSRPSQSARTTACTDARTSALTPTMVMAACWREDLALLQAHAPFTRRVLRAGEAVYLGGEAFSQLHVINAGQFKTVNFTADGRGQVVGLHFKGAWLGFDGIAANRYSCDAVALDTGEVWSMRYDTLLQAGAKEPRLMRAMHTAMSIQISRECDSLLSLGTLPADARVAHFINDWAESLAARDLRTDQIRLHMSRAEIGNYLGMTLETVSRALRRLADSGHIRFDEKGRRDISIPSLQALRELIRCAPDAADEAPWRAPAQPACRAS